VRARPRAVNPLPQQSKSCVIACARRLAD